MSPSRRDALRAAGGLGLTALAGCTALSGLGGPGLSLTLLNRDSRAHRLRVHLLVPGRDTADRASVHENEYRLGPRREDGAPAVVEEPGVAPVRKYLVRAVLAGDADRVRRHAHYFPPERDDYPDGGPTLHVAVRPGGDGAPRLDVFRDRAPVG